MRHGDSPSKEYSGQSVGWWFFGKRILGDAGCHLSDRLRRTDRIYLLPAISTVALQVFKVLDINSEGFDKKDGLVEEWEKRCSTVKWSQGAVLVFKMGHVVRLAFHLLPCSDKGCQARDNW
jgi:hypothetical protein